MQVIAHDLLSQFSNRQLNINGKSREKSIEKLSSGYRINRSADDAAGLSISEKMRWQIRGLNKGKNNIGEGISLIKTADGALTEVHSILQRVRELSLQAYNDTNTTSDRNAIQTEVDECLKEIDHIADTTTYNTKKLLKGNTIETVKVTADQEVEQTTTLRVTKDLPAWLSVDKVLEVHSAYTQAQDMSGGMLQYDGINESSKKYYGPKANCPAGYTWVAEWTGTIADNPSAKIDFSGLKTAGNVTDLYADLYNLIGGKISFPCGTCTHQVNSITFGGSEESITTTDFAASAEVDVTGNINLSETPFTYNGVTYNGYFDAVQGIVDTYSINYDDDTKNDDLTGEKNAVKALAESIAKDLRNKTYDVLASKMTDHFDRAVYGNDDYSLIVYDYRDSDKLTNPLAADAKVNTSADVTYKVKTSILEPGLEVEVESPMKIMCGALRSSYIEIGLYDLSLQGLGLEDYKINRYETKETYSDAYREKLEAWENNATEVRKTGTYTVNVIDKQTPSIMGVQFVNGELKPFEIQAGTTTYKQETRTYTYTEKVYGPKPVAGPGDVQVESKYSPDPLDWIDEAIHKVSEARSSMGAIQNRLEHAYNLNANTSENSQNSESKLRDTDMAKEMVEYSKQNILEQAGLAVMAQANQNRQGILQLLG